MGVWWEGAEESSNIANIQRPSGSSSSSSGNQATGRQVHGGGGSGDQNRSNQIQEKIKRQQQHKEIQKQNQINANNRARIEKMKASQSAQENRSYEERMAEEKGIDRYGNIVKDTFDPGWANKDRSISATDYYGDVQGTVDLANKLRAAGLDQNDPNLTQEERKALERLQFMQDEGVYGGVSGYEAEVNKMKKAIAEGTAGYKDSLAGLTRLSGGNEELAKISALGVQEYLRRKSKGDPGKLEDIITGKTEIEGLSPDFFKNLVYGGIDPKDPSRRTSTGTQIGTGNLSWSEDKYGQFIGGNAMGYDPTGAYTWSDIESDEEGLYQKYLNRGQNWNDPLSGLFPIYPSGSGGGGGGGGYGGGGGGGYAPPEDFMPQGRPNEAWGPQMPLQQAMVNIHGGKGFQQGFARGGIVSLVT